MAVVTLDALRMLVSFLIELVIVTHHTHIRSHRRRFGNTCTRRPLPGAFVTISTAPVGKRFVRITLQEMITGRVVRIMTRSALYDSDIEAQV